MVVVLRNLPLLLLPVNNKVAGVNLLLQLLLLVRHKVSGVLSNLQLKTKAFVA